MKTILNVILCSVLSLILPCQLHGQEPTVEQNNYHASIKLEGKPISREVSIRLKEGSKYFRITVKGSVISGSASATLYDADGIKICGLRLRAAENERSKGRMEEVLDCFDPGLWTLKIVNDTSVGRLTVAFNQH